VRAAAACTSFSRFYKAWDAPEVLRGALRLYTHKKEMPAHCKK